MRQALSLLAIGLWVLTIVAWFFLGDRASPDGGEVSDPVEVAVAVPPPDDGRVVVPVDLEQAEAVRTVMRENLVTLQQLLDASGRDDQEAVARIALAASRASGPGGLVPSLREVLPPEWRALGKAVHRDLGAVAEAASAEPAEVQRLLAQVTASCVSCHASFRLGPGDPAGICP